MKVVQAKTQKEILDNSYVRGKVFVVEQGIDWEIEFDGLDPECVLFTAYDLDRPIGAARLLNNKVGRVATLKSDRKKGVAQAIMKKLEEYARENNIKELKLHAQMYVMDFYKNIGYKEVGEVFYEADIAHIKMIKEII